ncbi:Na+/H+ antiporter subunit E [Chondromyces crocatus]|uniref:Cation:proton antiporter n=1 Tax=Chondromyces crocatus TaxID=52 RepID=A0A0K1EAT3_CHOCO|nr:Na+/H+ antiporter subunit E [Chondromyces crocatus]AKT37673.1 cation:proton antiporter [Chondromyces crocatus]
MNTPPNTTERSLLGRLFPHPVMSVLLASVWLLLINKLSMANVVFALVAGAIIPFVTRRFWPDRPRIRLNWTLVHYFGVVVWDIVIANFQIAWLVLFRHNRDLRSHWLVIPLDLDDPEAVSMLAATLCLAPGTVSSDLAADRRALLLHAIDVADPAAEIARIKSRYEAPLKRIFA